MSDDPAPTLASAYIHSPKLATLRAHSCREAWQGGTSRATRVMQGGRTRRYIRCNTSHARRHDKAVHQVQHEEQEADRTSRGTEASQLRSDRTAATAPLYRPVAKRRRMEAGCQSGSGPAQARPSFARGVAPCSLPGWASSGRNRTCLPAPPPSQLRLALTMQP